MVMPGNRLMILNQNEEECRKYTEYFEDSGYQVICCMEREEALDILSVAKNMTELFLYDKDMPDRRDYELIDKIRSLSDVAIVLLSRDSRLDTQLYAFSKKIDNYIVKPIPIPLLEAHIEAVIRRTGEKEFSEETVGALTIDYESRKIYLAGQSLRVTAKEFDLLEFFIRHRGMVLSRDKILDSVWGFDYVGGYRSVDTLVKKLRAKLTKEYPYIQTVYGVGYCFEV